MKITDEMVERATRTWCSAHDIDPDLPIGLTPGRELWWKVEAPAIRAALEAALAAAPPVEYAGQEWIEVGSDKLPPPDGSLVEAKLRNGNVVICIKAPYVPGLKADAEIVAYRLHTPGHAADAITALEARTREAEARIRELDAALDRLGSSEAFTVSQPIPTDGLGAEIAERMKFARDALHARTAPAPTKEACGAACIRELEAAVLSEREACARVANEHIPRIAHDGPVSSAHEAEYMTAGNIAAAIRARTQADAPAQTSRADDAAPPSAFALTDGERRVLRTLAGEGDFIGGWGAWVSVAIEGLHESGYVTAPPNVRITEAGRKALGAAEAPAQPVEEAGNG